MILVTLDPVTMRGGVLSIPRDLWVHIPGYTENRINTAHMLGDAYQHPGGGPALAVETVEYNLGVEIDYYVRFNFQAFVELVDRIGGIDVVVPEDIVDPLYPDYNYGYDPLYISAGPHHFFGEEALKYARTRHSTGGDFDRARRQQQVITAIFDRVTSFNLLPQLAIQAPDILNILENSVKIDPKLQLDEVIALANLGTQVDLDNISFRVIDESCTLFKVTPDEMMILVPLRDKIREVRDEVFNLNSNNGQQDTVEEEEASVSVLNGTTTSGLAYSTSQYLTANGIRITSYDNADRQDYDTSLLILNREKPLTAIKLLSLLDLPQSVVVNGANPTAQYDVVLILGEDYAANQVGLEP
jgi:LCP family protein required for cell wall assembly